MHDHFITRSFNSQFWEIYVLTFSSSQHDQPLYISTYLRSALLAEVRSEPVIPKVLQEHAEPPYTTLRVHVPKQ